MLIAWHLLVIGSTFGSEATKDATCARSLLQPIGATQQHGATADVEELRLDGLIWEAAKEREQPCPLGVGASLTPAKDHVELPVRPRFEIEPFIREGRLKVIMTQTPPVPVQLAAVYPHKKLQDPKVRLLLDFMADRCQRMIKDILAAK